MPLSSSSTVRSSSSPCVRGASGGTRRPPPVAERHAALCAKHAAAEESNSGLLSSVASALEAKEAFRERLAERSAQALVGGGAARNARQHERGKLTARERLEVLLDAGSFREYDKLKTHRCVDFGMERDAPPGDGVVTGHGTIGGRAVFVFSQDFSVFGGSLAFMTTLLLAAATDGRMAGTATWKAPESATMARRRTARMVEVVLVFNA